MKLTLDTEEVVEAVQEYVKNLVGMDCKVTDITDLECELIHDLYVTVVLNTNKEVD